MNLNTLDRHIKPLAKGLVNTTSLLYFIAFADTFGGLVQGVIPLTLMLRTTMIAYLLVYVLLSAKRWGTELLWFALIGYFLIKLMINYFTTLDEQVLSVEGGATLKLIYFPLLYAFLLDQLKKGKMMRTQLYSLLLAYGWLILASLVIGHVSGLGGVIEGRGIEMEGGKGFMIGANEVGLMLLLTAPFVGADLMIRTRSVVFGAMAQFLMYGIAGIHVFTKSSLIAALVAAYSACRAFLRRGRNARIFMWIVSSSLGALGVIQVYNNLDVIEAFALNTFFSALINDGVFMFLFRGRQEYISAIFPQLLEHPMNWLFLLFGAGEFTMRAMSVVPLMLMPGEGTTFEMDFFDVFGAYGLVGFLLYGGVLGVLLKQAGPRRTPMDISVAIFCVIVHSFLAGHVLFSPQVTTLLALVLLYYRSPRKMHTELRIVKIETGII